MKLRSKIIGSSLVIWLVFITLTILIFHETLTLSTLILFISLAVLFFFVFYLLLYGIIIKRISHANRQLDLDKNNADEITALIAYTNHISQKLHTAEDKLNQNIEEHEKIIPKDLTQLAHYDPLTSLPNRIFFNEMLNKTLAHASRNHKLLAILLLDLDHFKNINDALGPAIADDVLKEIALRLSATLRSGDIIARLGGDEFIILLNDISHPKFASSIAEKLLQVCCKAIKINGREFFITASIGIAIFPDDGDSLKDLLKNADLALYKAKNAGGGVYQYFIKEMTYEANKHIKQDQALHKALANNEFILHFQPKINLKHGVIIGVEALLRWVNPELGMITPAQFMSHIEENGLIIPIGEWVFREACRANKSWQSQGYYPINIAINVSPLQFRKQNIPQLLEKIFHETNLDPRYVELEITENTIMSDVKLTAQKLNEIKEMGVKICLDDFGTGYTSINYLKIFPIDVLKIDQSFIKGIANNQNDRAITSAIIALGHNLDMEVVAEGVETVEQLQFLAEHNCDIVQGYYFGRPVPELKMVLQLGRPQ